MVDYLLLVIHRDTYTKYCTIKIMFPNPCQVTLGRKSRYYLNVVLQEDLADSEILQGVFKRAKRLLDPLLPVPQRPFTLEALR